MLAPLALLVLAAPVLSPEVGFGAPGYGPATGSVWGLRAAQSPSSVLAVWTDSRGELGGSEVFGALVTQGAQGPVTRSLRIAVRGDADREPAVAFGGGRFLVAWENGSRGWVLGQLYDEAGAPVGSNFPIAYRSGSGLDVAWDGAAFVVARSGFNGSTEEDLFVNEVTPAGMVGADQVLAAQPGWQGWPTLGCDGARHCLAVWEDRRSSGTTGTDIYGARIDSGAVLDPGGLALVSAMNDQYLPTAAWVSTNWLLTWNEPTVNDVGALQLDAAAAPIGGPLVLFGASADARYGRLAALGGAALSLRSEDGNLVAQRVDAAAALVDAAPVAIQLGSNGYAMWPVAAQPVAAAPFVAYEKKDWRSWHKAWAAQLSPALAPEQDGGFPLALGGTGQERPRLATDGTHYLAVWSEELPGGPLRVVGALLGADGAPLDGGQRLELSAPGSTQEYPLGPPDVSCSQGQFLVAWEGRAPNGSSAIYARGVTAAGGLVGAAPFLISDPASPGESSPVVAGGPSQFLVAWQGNEQVVARRVAAGTPTGSEVALTAGLYKKEPFSASAVGDDFVVAWVKHGSPEWTPHLGRVSGAGAALDAPEGVSLLAPPWTGGDAPAVECHAQGCVAVWETGADILGRAFDAQLGFSGPPFLVSGAAGAQRRPALAWQGNGYLAAWEDGRGGAAVEVYGAQLSASGATLDPAGFLLATAPHALRRPGLQALGPGRALLGYERFDDAAQVEAYRVRLRAVLGEGGGAERCATQPDGTPCGAGGVCVQAVCTAPSGSAGGFSSTPGVFLTCGERFRYDADNQPLVSGPGTPAFSLAPWPGEALPAGLSVDAATGALEWTPSKDEAGQHRAVLIVRGEGWAAAQVLELNVECAARNLKVGCAAAPGAGGGVWLIAALFLARRRRR